MKQKMTKAEKTEARWGWLFIAPTMIGLIVLNFYPIVNTIWQSFCKTGDFGRGNTFVGLKNYTDVLSGGEFWSSLWNTFKYAIIEVPFSVCIALVLAVLLNRKMKGRSVYRTYCWLGFDGAGASHYAELCGFGEGVYMQECRVEPEAFLKTAEKMMQDMKPGISSVLKRTAVMYEFLALAVESYAKSGHGSLYQPGYLPDMYVDCAVDLIKKNYRHISIADLAKYVGINRSYLADIFKKKMKMSPQQYLLRYRLEKSCELLRTTELPIQEVAKRIGYDNPLAFTKMFKKIYEMSPSKYRMHVEKEDWERMKHLS